jgi:hypothetical protein
MNGIRPLSVLALVILVGCQSDSPPPTVTATPPQPAPQQPIATAATQAARQTTWDVRTFRCDQLMGLDDDDRAAAAMFYYGYLAAGANMTVIDTSRIEGNIRRVMDQCARTPNSTVPDAFRQALAPAR